MNNLAAQKHEQLKSMHLATSQNTYKSLTSALKELNDFLDTIDNDA